jgi:hypothetical protein
MADVQHVEVLGQEAGKINFRVHGATDRDLCPDIYQLARQNDWILCELRKEVRTLEAVFNELTVADGGVQ